MKLIWLLVFCIGGSVHAQDPFYYTINNTNGLPSNSVYDIFQDSKGFMWFATDKGLCRYDGSEFITYTSEGQTSKAGSCINEDKYGRIWYCNFDGFLYYVEKGELKNLDQPKSTGYIKYGIINDRLYLVQPESVLLFNLKTLLPAEKVQIGEKNIQATFTSNDIFYVLGDRLHGIKNNSILVNEDTRPHFDNSFKAPIIQQTNNGLLFTSKFSNHYFTYTNGVFREKAFNNTAAFIQNISVTDQYTWLCTPNGITRYDIEKGEGKNFFPAANISYLYKDRQNNYWISTLNNGLMFIRDFDNIFIPIQPRPTIMSQLDERIIIGTENESIYSFNSKKETLKNIYKNYSNHPIRQLTADSFSKKIYFTSSRFKILNDKLQIENEISTAIKDVKRVDGRYYSIAASGLCGLLEVNKIATSKWQYKTGNSDGGLFKGFNTIILLTNTNGKSTAYNPANACLYYATNNGLKCVSMQKTEDILYKNKPVYINILQYRQNKIVALTTNEELLEIDQANHITLFPLPPNLVNERFTKFKIQGDVVFLFTKNAIIEYNPLTKEAKNILPVSNNLEVSDVMVIGQKIYYLTAGGMLIKSSSKIDGYAAPKLVINEVKVNGNRVETDKLKNLSYGEHEIMVNFSTLSYIPNQKYAVLYKVNNNEWGKLNADNKNLVLSSLSPGNYQLQLKIDGIKNAPVESLSFYIGKPFWLTKLFILGISMLIIFLFWSIYKKQINKIKKKNSLIIDKINLEKNLNQSKLKAIKSQMNPHFFYNALNTIQSYILANDKKQAVNYLSKFSALTRTILEMSEKETIPLSEEIKTLGLYLDIEKARFSEDFEYDIKTVNISDADHIKIPAMLLQPYIENAVKHGLLHKNGPKNLSVTFEKQPDQLLISIDDNGIGMKKSAELNAIKNKNHRSFATGAMQTRIDLLNKNNSRKISISNIEKQNGAEQSLGTTVIINIPITNN
ncbi:MAG: histidine kinase [Chitinophagaceae bacterium]|nr:histidine kinase [Chitinophagaceae bacterium]